MKIIHDLFLLHLAVLCAKHSGLDSLAWLHWVANERSWSTDRLGTELVEGAD